MPEGRELILMEKQAQQWFQRMQSKPGWDPKLLDVFIDATEDERKSLGSARFKSGLVDRLERDMDLYRGCSGGQRPLFPYMFGSLQELLDRELRLTAIEYTGRSIILHFGELLFQMQPLVHTNLQIYDEPNWAAVYRTSHLGKTPEEKMRTFRCAIAFKIGEHVISFNSNDLVYQVSWAWAHERNHPTKGLVHRDCSPLDKWPEFMESWAALLRKKVDGKKKLKGLLHNWLRDSDNTALNTGVGAYSCSELMYIAGLPPDLTLGELLKSPSRLCRFLLALYQFLYDARFRIWLTVVRPSINNDMLSPNVDQRLRYANVVYVWAKDRVSTSSRHCEAISAHNASAPDSCEEHDAWEPTLVMDALRMAPEFGPWIFGEASWDTLKHGLGPSASHPWLENPLIGGFRELASKKFLSCHNTHLDSTQFAALFLSREEMREKIVPTLLYGHGGKITWTVCEAKRSPKYEFIDGTERSTRLFRPKVRGTRRVEIGPLEYCGVAMNVEASNGKEYVYPSRGAPTQAIPHSVARTAVIQSITKVKEWTVETEGGKKTALSAAERELRERAYAAFDAAYPQEWLLPQAEEASPVTADAAIDAIDALTINPLSIDVQHGSSASASTSPAPSAPAPKKTRKRRSQFDLHVAHSEDTVDGSAGRGKRAKRELDPDAYNTGKHHVDRVLSSRIPHHKA
ncbi:hypothetical protein PENSPDRAFT_749541 [Peniophora sp. CONT]|nr:hypothetical protein PENSPDRAFT_749541 [Peniophora sp. CONT]